MKQLILAISATLLCVSATVIHAGHYAGVSIIRQHDGKRLPVWRHKGHNYIAGAPGERYAIQVTNKSGGRLLSVISVDGVNVISGETAASSQQGYVLDIGQSAAIDGWRKSMDEVAAFYFTQLPDTYAARTGRPDNVGVIGVALFQEYVEPEPALQDYDKAMASAAAPSAAAEGAGTVARRGAEAQPQAEKRIGTGHGERRSSSTRYTDFQRNSSSPVEIITLHYDTAARLMARGIMPRPAPYPRPRRQAQPFPGEFVPDPG